MPRLPLILLALAATPAAAREYTLVIHEAPAQLALRADTGPRGAAYWQGFAAAGQALARAGALKGGAALEPRAAASLGSGAAGPTPTGYFIVEAADLAAARALAAGIPAARTGRVDIIAHAPAQGPAKTGM
ncbi:YciI family protein [Sandarakinorhabdus sp. DWP1-3-1]|uniref:YciI family protein n=1 Tax=Sandarakinorhabdus sp. DWP1-3-1 TaxID=2804627 RepID=UPI003CE90160